MNTPTKILARFQFAPLLCSLLALPCNAEIAEHDVCVYGGTASGVTAAVEVARQGKSVVLLEPGQHIGGMTSGGLDATDIGNKDVIGGLSREFYRRVAQHYAKDESWTQESREEFFAERSKRTKLAEVQGENATMWTFEPHVAEQILKQMLEEAKVPVRLGQRLALVKKDGERITEILVEGGDVIRAKMFIDATYEGDLMAMSGVSYRVGREANALYNETLNGIRAETPKNQIYGSVDPYVTPGDPMSGLIPLIQRGSGGIPGDGDQRVQAYNFRLCFTNIPENRRALEPPANYDPARYELAARRVEKIVAANKVPTIQQFCHPVWMPNGKTDINNSQGISTDFIGENYDYPDADYATRAEIWQAHEDYIRGFWYFMSTSPRMPESLRAEFQSFGPCKDEFQDTDGWSHQLYVREARRMVSDYVMTEHNCRSKIIAEDPVGMAAYGMDSHNCQRIVQGGAARNEGDVQEHGLKPYPISYRSIVPKETECENLLVPVCVSATHIAFGSIRMEPVFMVLGQSAGTAAVLAIEEGLSVQQINFKKLQSRILANGQVLERPMKSKSAAKSKPKAPKIVCFGDSITKRGFPAELEKLLGVEILNSGIAGNTTRHGLRRMKQDVLDHHPEIVVILFGTNDSRLAEGHVHVPVDQYSRNLDEMVRACTNRRIHAVLCTLPPIDAEPYFARHRVENFTKAGGLTKVLEDYRDAALQVAKKLDVPSVDLYRLLGAEPNWMHSDGVHPSPEGNRIIARLIAKHVQNPINKQD
ncbi:FAD-dependent oxidoreductase [Adhaeretor mobilis]|nr:FAD-dependent oxidoreductase [Adhaeretor mobilis]